jgi:hypothetical protein
MAVDRGRPEPTQGRLPRYSARDGIGILVLSAYAEVELDVAFHVLRRFSAGAGAVQKVWKYRRRLARTTLSGSLWELKEKKYQDFLSWRGCAVPLIAAADEPRWMASRSTTSARAFGARRSLLVSPCRLGGGEKVGEQLCDALGRVVMHPVRRAEQALDAVQVGHIVVVGLG